MVRKLKLYLIDRLARALGIKALHTRVAELEFRVPISDTRLDQLELELPKAARANSVVATIEKRTNSHFQNLYDSREQDHAELDSHIGRTEERLEALEAKIGTTGPSFEEYQPIHSMPGDLDSLLADWDAAFNKEQEEASGNGAPKDFEPLDRLILIQRLNMLHAQVSLLRSFAFDGVIGKNRKFIEFTELES